MEKRDKKKATKKQKVGKDDDDKKKKKKDKKKEKKQKDIKEEKKIEKEKGTKESIGNRAEEATLRILTYNVHRFVDDKGEDNLLRVIDVIQRLSPDIVGLQEAMFPYNIPKDAKGILKKYRGKPMLEALVGEVGLPHFIYCQEIYSKRHSAYYGNALLSKYPFKSQPTRHNINGIAGLIVADIDLSSSPLCRGSGSTTSSGVDTLRVGVTHLDPSDEDLRLEQIQKAMLLLNQPELEEAKIFWKPRKNDPDYEAEMAQIEKQTEPEYSKDTSVPHVLIGDLNAMRQSDYTPEHWQYLIEFCKKKDWNPPSSLAMNAVNAAAYKDAFLVAGEGEMFTSWTYQPTFRLDYILASANLPLKIIMCKRVDSDASDHFPVYADFVNA